MGDLERDTLITGADGAYSCELSRDWEIWGPNGGYIAWIALRAAGVHTRFDRPASIVGHFLGVAAFEPLDIRVDTLRSAKRAESLRVSLTQHGAPIFEALVWAVSDVAGLEHDVSTFPNPTDPDQIPSIRDRLGDDYGNNNPYQKFWSNFDERVPDEDWITDWDNRPPRPPEHGHWYRFLPASTFADPWVDACRSLLLSDTLGWPAASQLHLRPAYIAPSIDISCAFHRARPAEPWLYARATAESAANGLIGCESRVWARDGTLLAVGASQLLCRPAPPMP